MTYPPIPLNAISKEQIKNLQLLQNKSVRLITSASPLDLIPTSTLHRRADIPTINQYLNHQANKIWDNIRNQQRDQYNRLRERFQPNHQYYPSNIKKHNRNEEPYYGR